MVRKSFLLGLLIVFLFSFLAMQRPAHALQFYNWNFNMTQDVDSLNVDELGGLVPGNCTCRWLDVFCWWQCTYGGGNYSHTNCFSGQPYWTNSSPGGGNALWFNNTCLQNGGYNSIGIYALDSVSHQRTFTSPSNATTIFVQVRYYVSTWTNITLNQTLYPILEFTDASGQVLPSARNLTLTSGGDAVTTIWHTFPAGSQYHVGWFIPEYNSMPQGWQVYFKYFRVGTVDKEVFLLNSQGVPNASQMMADCGYSTGSTGANCGTGPVLEYDSDTGVNMSVEIHDYLLGEDNPYYYYDYMPWNGFQEHLYWRSDLFCEAIYFANWTLHNVTGKSTYIVRMPLEMYPFNGSSTRGLFHSEYSSMTSGGGNDGWTCYMLGKDLLTMTSSYNNWFVNYMGYKSEGAGWGGMFDTLNPNQVRFTTFGYGSSSDFGDFCSWQPIGVIDFGPQSNQSIVYGSVPLGNISFEAGHAKHNTVHPNCPYTVGDLIKQFRWNVPASYLNLWNISGDEWRLTNMYSGGNSPALSSSWIPSQYFYYGSATFVSCLPRWTCQNNTEVYLNETCDTSGLKWCSCGCGADRCVSGFEHWECANNGTDSVHYTSDCAINQSVVCEFGCGDNGQCSGQNLCKNAADCSNYCSIDKTTLYYNPYCDNLTGLCAWNNSKTCQYNCSDVFNNCNPRSVLTGTVVPLTGAYLGLDAASTELFLALLIAVIVSGVITFIISYKGGVGGAGIVFGVSFIAVVIMFAMITPPWINPIAVVLLVILAGVLVAWQLSRIIGG